MPFEQAENSLYGQKTVGNRREASSRSDKRHNIAQRQKEKEARHQRKKGSRQNPRGRNRTSDQLISENTETQYTTLQSIALPTELHSVVGTLHHISHKIRLTGFDTHNHTPYAALHIISAMPRLLSIFSAHHLTSINHGTHFLFPTRAVAVSH